MKDNFSENSNLYNQFRPNYPQELIEFILANISHRKFALDIGTGNGQMAQSLAPYFDEIEATDISQAQIDEAVRMPNIHYSIQSAESTNFPDEKFDLIVVAQAAHWFNFELFYPEVDRLLAHNGSLAIVGYGLIEIEKEIDAIIRYLYKDILGKYWDAERKYIDEKYQTLPFPYTNQDYKEFENTFLWNFQQMIGYLGTWSAVKHYIKANNTNPIQLIADKLEAVWAGRQIQVNFPTFVLLTKKQIRL